MKQSLPHKKYTLKIQEIYTRSHKIYTNTLPNIITLSHQEYAYYSELQIRANLIKEFNIDINNILFQFNKNSTDTDSKNTLRKVKSYLYYVSAEQENKYQKNDNLFKKNPLSMHELLGIKHLLTKKQFDLITKYDTDYNPAIRECYFDIDDKQYFYYEIWNDIYHYLKNSEAEYKNYCLKEYGNLLDNNNNNRYLSDLILIVDNIFLDIEKVIFYLNEAQCLTKYKLKLIDYFKYYQPLTSIQATSAKDDISDNYYPNRIINYKINLNNSLDAINQDVENLYYEFQNKNLLDIDLLYQKNLKKTTHETQIKRNRSAKLSFIDKLYIFDAKLFGLTNEQIIEQLFLYYVGDEKHTNQAFKSSTISKHYEDIKKLLINDTYIEYITGVNINKIL